MAKSFRLVHEERGFTLIEVMVVLGITGLLAVIASASFEKYVAKGRQSEAKLMLSSIFVAEHTFFGEHSSFTTCLSGTAFERTGDRIFYAVGFSSSPSTCGNDTEPCHMQDFIPGVPCNAGAFPAGGLFVALQSASSGGPVNRTVFNASTTTSITRAAFRISAVGRISNGGGADVWTMDDRKVLINERSGL